MSRRYYHWALILFVVHCTSFLDRRNDFEKGVEFYKRGELQKAVEHLTAYYTKRPRSDTTLYYLYDCYKKLNKPLQGMKVLEQLVKIGTRDENVYLSLFSSYRRMKQYKKSFSLLVNAPPKVKKTFDDHYTLTRRLFAEIVCGVSKNPIRSDPIVFAVSKKYLPLFLDGKFHDSDTITNGNLIIILDKLIEPIYPEKFFALRNIPNDSYLYLPYMRLISFNIIDLKADLVPDAPASLTTAAQAVLNLKKRGIID
ncbi:MAG TPA: hypothetical protein ENI34_04715 [candidate division WOR-3 bacterium]|uniref:Tetratricopeptide repeat protein n=1 Tax=candidate division WOR-3 bacterium TaxID=2052148 RepID=A0A9C9K052_UNCW3|nr:hypothetical protein [candidate division WOR-3 bacterium]